jgi:predicted nucleic acid-binding protein
MIGLDTTFLVHVELVEMPEHPRASSWLQSHLVGGGEELAIAPQVLCEFIHIVTDPKRFQRPLSMDAAIVKASHWWNAAEVRHVFPTSQSTDLFLQWLTKYRLGRKRLLDTQLAACFWDAGVRRILTSNARDFRLFGFDVVAW